MAIDWDVKITPLDIDRKEISLVATYVDDTDPEDVKTGAFAVLSALIQTTQQKVDVMDNVWAQYQADLIRKTKISAFIGNLEQQAKENLEARS